MILGDTNIDMLEENDQEDKSHIARTMIIVMDQLSYRRLTWRIICEAIFDGQRPTKTLIHFIMALSWLGPRCQQHTFQGSTTADRNPILTSQPLIRLWKLLA